MLAAVERIRPYSRPCERVPALAAGGRTPLVTGKSTMKEAA